jgi:hypothetical protein
MSPRNPGPVFTPPKECILFQAGTGRGAQTQNAYKFHSTSLNRSYDTFFHQLQEAIEVGFANYSAFAE